MERYLQIEKGLAENSLHPNNVKKELAETIVAFFHGQEVGRAMREQFESVFKNKDTRRQPGEVH